MELIEGKKALRPTAQEIWKTCCAGKTVVEANNETEQKEKD